MTADPYGILLAVDAAMAVASLAIGVPSILIARKLRRPWSRRAQLAVTVTITVAGVSPLVLHWWTPQWYRMAVGGCVLVVGLASAAWSAWMWHRMAERLRREPAVPEGEVRPRFGELTRADGSAVPLVFRQTDDPTVFVGRRAGSEELVVAEAGDAVEVDVLGPGQSVTFGAVR